MLRRIPLHHRHVNSQILPAIAKRYSSAASSADYHIEGSLLNLPSGHIPEIGVHASLRHSFSLSDAQQFATLTGDNNPIHTDASAAEQHLETSQQEERKPVVQGLLSASLFATIIGRSLPGAVYIQQTLRWRTPLLVDEQVTARIKVVRVRKRFVDCETVCEKTSTGAVVVEGSATLLVPIKSES